jgi:hypothetical protein
VAFANDCLESGYQTLRDVRNLTLDQKTAGELIFVLYDPRTGAPIDLTEYDSSSSSSGNFTGVKLAIKESPSENQIWDTEDLEVVDGPAGQLKLTYDVTFTRRAGIFTGQIELWEDEIMQRVIPYFVTINPNLKADSSQRGLSLSVAEIRMAIRDVDPEANYLLDELDFSDQEIALAVRRCVDYWNEVPPPVSVYTATNFPWRYHLSLGAAAILHNMAANQKMRNDLPYKAGGLTVQDTIKYKQYLEFHERYWKQWMDWVRAKKYQINIDTAYSSLQSGYAYDYFYR